MPRSVNRPVKCVVLTAALEIDVTREFCSPIAKSKLNATQLGWFNINDRLDNAIMNNIELSNIVGTTYIYLSLFLETISTIKLEVKEPKRNDRMYRK